MIFPADWGKILFRITSGDYIIYQLFNNELHSYEKDLYNTGSCLIKYCFACPTPEDELPGSYTQCKQCFSGKYSDRNENKHSVRVIGRHRSLF